MQLSYNIRTKPRFSNRTKPNSFWTESVFFQRPNRNQTEIKTSSSAVAESPRDALCPSVVSLDKIITRAEFFIIVT